MQFADRALGHRHRGGRETPHPEQGVIVIDGFEVITQRLAADRDAMLDDLGRLSQGGRVPLDGIRRVGQFDIIVLLDLCQCRRRERPERVERGLPVSYPFDQAGVQHGVDVVVGARAHCRADIVPIK